MRFDELMVGGVHELYPCVHSSWYVMVGGVHEMKRRPVGAHGQGVVS